MLRNSFNLIAAVTVSIASINCAGASEPPTLGEKSFDPLKEKVTSLISIGKCNYPTFSPDGKTLAFVSNMSGTEQIWTVPLSGGWPTQLTAAEALVGATWSPSSDWIGFMAGTGSRQLYVVRSDSTGLKRIANGNNQISAWSKDGHQIIFGSDIGGRQTAPYSGNAETGEVKPLIGDASDVDKYFINDTTSDGKYALATLWNSNVESQLFRLTLANGEKLPITDSKEKAMYSGGGINRAMPLLSADEHAIYCVTNQGRKDAAFAKILLDNDWHATGIAYIAARDDQKCIGFCLNRKGTTAATVWKTDRGDEIDLVDLSTGKTEVLPLPSAQSCDELEFSPDGQDLALAMSGSALPQDIFIFHISDKSYRQLTHSQHPGIDLKSLVIPELVTFNNADGTK